LAFLLISKYYRVSTNGDKLSDICNTECTQEALIWPSSSIS
jgi:hypothetical protein